MTVSQAFFHVHSGKRGGRKQHNFWTEEKEAALRDLVSPTYGYSATQIGKILGCSRCAVIGKVDRMKLKLVFARYRAPVIHARAPEEESPPKQRRPRLKAPAPARVPEAFLRPAEPEPVSETVFNRAAAKTPPAHLKPLLRLKPGDCRFPFGDPRSGKFGFCGAPSRAGSSFCDLHRALCYTAPRERATA